VPLYVYRNIDEFASAMEQYVRVALREGLYGWAVNDCLVTIASSNYSIADGATGQTRAAEYRRRLPQIDSAGTDAGSAQRRHLRLRTDVPNARIDAPATSNGSVLAMLAQQGAAVHAQSMRGEDISIEAELPAEGGPSASAQAASCHERRWRARVDVRRVSTGAR
jgi:ribosomal protection tetracycline resistance protein